MTLRTPALALLVLACSGAFSAVSAGCGTTHASVTALEPAEAHALVVSDLDALAESPAELRETQWRRAYRHFDRHLEPHLDGEARLELEIAFGQLRRQLKMAPPTRGVEASNHLEPLCDRIEQRLNTLVAKMDLQPQD